MNRFIIGPRGEATIFKFGLVIPLIFLSSCATLDKGHKEWSRWDKVCGAYFLGGHSLDMVSTEEMLDRGHREMNPILGRHPSDEKLVAYGVATTVLALVVADQAGKKSTGWRKALLLFYGSLGFFFGIHNYNLYGDR